MRALLLPLVVALALHGFLLSLESRWLKAEFHRKPRPLPVAVTLTYRPPEKPVAAPAPKTAPQRLKAKAEKKLPEKAVPASKPRRKAPPKPAVARKKPPPGKPGPQRKVKAAKPPPEPIRPSLKKRIPEPAARQESPPVRQSSIPEPAPEQEPSLNTRNSDANIFEQAFNFAAKPPADSSPESLAAPPAKPLQEAVPVYRRNPPPRYPARARRRAWEGAVVLEVLVNRKGRVDDLRVHATSGHKILDKAALRAVRDWLFEPGRRGAEKVVMWVRVPIRFELR